VRPLGVGALSEDLNESVDSAFPVLAEHDVVIVSHQTANPSKSMTMLIVL
jgi:hypothetical protein